jgi:predicted NUDIX family NTP pyrophosphohydrolase
MKYSAGLLMYRRIGDSVEVFLVHPGGPFFKKKEAGYWSIPKGLVDEDEADLDAARREFEEETSIPVIAGQAFLDLGEIRQKGGKRVRAWAFEGEADVEKIRSNSFEMEWPPRSGRRQSFPEIDRGAWFDIKTARTMIIEAQRSFLDRLCAMLAEPSA